MPGLIAYSEATRYTSAKRLQAEAWCRANDRRLGPHVLYPRTKGFIACVQTLRQTQHVKAVYDVTIAYAKDDVQFQSPPQFLQTLMLPRLRDKWRFLVHVERHRLEDLPKDDKGLALWLEDCWVRKGERLEELRGRLKQGLPWDAQCLALPKQD